MKHVKFDPNAAASDDSGVFGLPYDEQESKVVYLPVPWDVTTSYRPGTAAGPQAILIASSQQDLFDEAVEDFYQVGLFMREPSKKLIAKNKSTRQLADPIIDAGGVIPQGARGQALLKKLSKVNQACADLNDWVYDESLKLLKKGKIPVALGGDHATPFGAMKAFAQHYSSIGVLHFDAHADLRDAFEGFTWSHASILRNVLDHCPGVTKLLQVGLRDFCDEEVAYAEAQGERVEWYTDRTLKTRKYRGETWGSLCDEMIEQLPENVYITFDIDALDPKLCPHTGTPVPGGLEYHEALYLIETLARSGRKIVGFDLNEVAPNPWLKKDEWNANVGMRLLYRMTGLMLASQGLARWR